jgi:glutamate carboxypeptidase
MKGGDVIMVGALKALKAAGVLDRLNLAVIFTGDEESSGQPLAQSKAALVEAAKVADYAIGFEDGADDPATAVVSRRSAGGWTLRVTGTPAHSSQIFRSDIGAGAVFEAARILDAFRLRLQGQAYLTFNPGMALGGTIVTTDSGGASGSASGKTNVVAARMEVRGDLRAISPEQLAATQGTMREIVSQNLPGTAASIEFAEGYPPLAPSEGNRRVLAIYDSASRVLGLGAVVGVDPAKAGAADVSFAAPYVKGAIDGIGLPGSGTHTESETTDLRMLAPLTKRAALLLLWLAQSGPPRA